MFSWLYSPVLKEKVLVMFLFHFNLAKVMQMQFLYENIYGGAAMRRRSTKNQQGKHYPLNLIFINVI